MENMTLVPEVHNYDTQPEELIPCPFCGSAPIWHLKGNYVTPSRMVIIQCKSCGVKMEMAGRALGPQALASKIMKKWNTRK